MKVSAVTVDVTAGYSLKSEDAPLIKEIRDVFFFFPEERTYCCEMTPSYNLMYLYTYVVCMEEDISEKVRERLDERYCHEPTEDCYMHCSRVEKLSPKDCGEFDDEDSAREYLQGNCPF